MAIADDVSVAANGDIRWTGSGTTSYTVLELHRFLQGLADDASASGNDLVDITSDTPSERSTDNIVTLLSNYNIDDTMAEHLYDGSISQGDDDTHYKGLEVIGNVNNGTVLQIVQNNEFVDDDTDPYWGATASGAALNGDADAGIIMRTLIKTREDGFDIDGTRIRVQARELGDTFAEFSVTMGLGVNVAAMSTSSDLNNQTAEATIAALSVSNSNEGYNSLDVNADGTNETYYSNWQLNSNSINDLYEYGKWLQSRDSSQVAAQTSVYGMNGMLFRGITHEIAFDASAGDDIAEESIVAWGPYATVTTSGMGTFTIGDKLTFSGGGQGRLLAIGYNGGTTTRIVFELDTTSDTPASGETVTGEGDSPPTGTLATGTVDNSVVAGSGVVLGMNKSGNAGTAWIQLIRGAPPADNQSIVQNKASGTGTTESVLMVNGAPVARTVPLTMMGQSTGSAIIGSYGLGINPDDLTANDQLFDLTNTLRVPPNNVSFSLLGLTNGDSILVGPEDGSGSLDADQLSLSTALNGAAETSVVVSANIPDDTPSTGSIRVKLDNGIYKKLSYTSYSGATFTIPSTDFSTDDASSGNDVFISYLDKVAASATESFTVVYDSDRTLFVRVRNGGTSPIKTFETTAVLRSGGGSATAIRTSDA